MKLTVKRAKPLTLPIQKKAYTYDPRVDGVSQSQIATWLDCREKARLSICEGLQSRAVSKPLIHGDVMHRVLDVHYQEMRSGQLGKMSDHQAMVPQWVDAATKGWKSENKNATSESLEILEEAAAISLVIGHYYIKHWWDDDSKVTWRKIEEQFKVPVVVHLGGARKETVLLVGKIDGEFVDKKGRSWLFETKNKGQFSHSIENTLPMDLQLGTYLTALGRVSDMKPSFVLYNLVRRPQERRKDKETFRDFAERVGANIAKDPNHYFQRHVMQLEDSEVARHEFALDFRVAEFYKWWEFSNANKGKTDPMWNGGACENKYGTCGMLPICCAGDRGGHEVRGKAHPELF